VGEGHYHRHVQGHGGVGVPLPILCSDPGCSTRR
jgi:hypothetical protein